MAFIYCDNITTKSSDRNPRKMIANLRIVPEEPTANAPTRFYGKRLMISALDNRLGSVRSFVTSTPRLGPTKKNTLGPTTTYNSLPSQRAVGVYVKSVKYNISNNKIKKKKTASVRHNAVGDDENDVLMCLARPFFTIENCLPRAFFFVFHSFIISALGKCYLPNIKLRSAKDF